MNKKSGDILLLVIGALLLGYTAFRSVDILRGTLPADAQVLAYIGLAGLDGGLLGWTLYYKHSARGEVQQAVSLFMIAVELFGVSLTSIGDSLLHTAGASMPEYVLVAVTWGVPGIIALNIIALTVVHVADPSAQIEQAKVQLEDEVQRQVAQQLRDNVAQLAGAVAPQAALHQAQELLQAFQVGKGGGLLASKNGNGHGAGKEAALLGADGVALGPDDTQPIKPVKPTGRGKPKN
jgi:hypothetical protein